MAAANEERDAMVAVVMDTLVTGSCVSDWNSLDLAREVGRRDSRKASVD